MRTLAALILALLSASCTFDEPAQRVAADQGWPIDLASEMSLRDQGDRPDQAVDLGRPDLGQPLDQGVSDLGRLDMDRDLGRPPDMNAPDINAPDMNAPDMAVPDMNAPDMAAPDMPPSPDALAQVVVGRTFSCARYSDGRVACWGGNARGELGRGTTDAQPQPTPAVIPNLRAVSLSAGRSHSCAVTASGEVFCWGDNTHGQLGFKPDPNDPTKPALLATPTKVTFNLRGDRGLAAQVSTREEHTCALMRSKDVTCWGKNTWGQLGTSAPSSDGAPTLADINDAVEVAVGGLHSCARLSNGQLWCWGYNYHGQLGRQTQGLINATPAPIVGLPSIRSLHMGGSYSCALTAEAASRQLCWGWFPTYPSDDRNNMQAPTPVPITGLVRPVDLATGEAHLCAVQADSKVLCWGRDLYSELGRLVTPADQGVPTALNRTGFKQISAKALHTCALDVQGDVFCWGDNSRGQLGDGTTTRRDRPVLVRGL